MLHQPVGDDHALGVLDQPAEEGREGQGEAQAGSQCETTMSDRRMGVAAYRFL
ncbi:MAG: hypothetical protein JNK40_12355 [Chromatiales bacterium]|nr:hypothetical protein [Chromatiales bacterium]